jgi:hypothetical protein
MPLPTGPTVPIKFQKAISSLPGTLTPDSLYAVRVGEGIDLYVSDMTGNIAYKSNSATGLSGYSGAVGISGYSGAVGISGYSGIDGASGYSGATGNSGYSGIDGASGYSGAVGISGYSGAVGISGPGANQYLNTTSSVTFTNLTIGPTGVITFANGSTQSGRAARMIVDQDFIDAPDYDAFFALLLPGDFYWSVSYSQIKILVDYGGYYDWQDLTVYAV